MKTFLEYIYNMKFDATSIGIQKNLLLAALIGVISNLPKEIKSNFKQAVHIIVGTLLSTILTPMIISLIDIIFKTTLPPQSGYGIAALIGICGTPALKRILLRKLEGTNNTNKDETTNT